MAYDSRMDIILREGEGREGKEESPRLLWFWMCIVSLWNYGKALYMLMKNFGFSPIPDTDFI